MKINKHFTFLLLKYTKGTTKVGIPHICKWLIIACGLHFVACSSPAADNGKTVFHYNEPDGIATLDPAFSKNRSIIGPVHQIFNTLVETDNNLHIVSSLAKSWDISADRRTWTFHLRGDVSFQDNAAFPGGKGRKMVADDVVYSFSRIVDKRVASSGAWIFLDKIAGPSAFLALNDSTFQLTLIRPFNPILGLLSMQYCAVVPREVVTLYGKEFRNHPCGTGPFRFKSWDEGQDLILLKNEHYFEKDSLGQQLPYLDAVKVSFFDNRATEFLLFRQGQLDFINEIDASFKDEVLNKRGELKQQWRDKIHLSTHPQLNTEYLGILIDTANELVRHSPLRWRQVRQAINYGFDRRKMMLYLRNSIGIAAESGFIPAGFPSFDSSIVKGYHYDPVLARKLLAEAGFPDGRDMPVIRLLTVANYADFSSYIARQLKELGITIQVEVVQKSLLLEQTARSQALFFRGSWMADYPDAENYLSVFYSKNPAPPNYTRYNNPVFDRLYEQALLENDDSKRMDLYRRMDQMVINDAPIVPLWYDEVIWLVNPRVEGLTPNALNLLELRRVRIASRTATE
jgi:peptide/nickel transport system substrate-binding protein